MPNDDAIAGLIIVTIVAMIIIIVMMMIEDELEIQELLPPISLQFISLAKLSRACRT